nr:SpoIIE family protein phosphatase [Thermoflexibacter sp.]
LVLPCYFLTLLYFLYVDIAKNQFMLAAYARIFPLLVVSVFTLVCFSPTLYKRWGYFLHHLCLFSLMVMMTFILSQSTEKPFYNSAIVACIMIIVIILIEERGGLRVTLPIYLIPAILTGIYFFYIDLPDKKVSPLSNPIAFILACLVYSQVQERFRWRDFINVKTIQKQHEEVLTQSKEIAHQKHEIETQNEELTQLNEELTVMVETIETQHKSIQEQNNKIKSSITYAKRLQSAILPYSERFDNAFGDANYFILYKPKDIVSGDFYWLYSDETQVILAVVDCTGHGVPGAFMSILGSQLLSEIVEQRGICEPHKILNELHKQVRRVFKQDQSDNRDGMELQLLRVLKKENKIQYAGAMNPIYLISNEKFEEIKADKKPIGGHQIEEERLFSLQEWDIAAPTLLYLCTDGYQDQFGGEKDKKFMVGQLKDTIFRIHHLEMKRQESALEQALLDWQGTQIQVDDITIIGLKIL